MKTNYENNIESFKANLIKNGLNVQFKKLQAGCIALFYDMPIDFEVKLAAKQNKLNYILPDDYFRIFKSHSKSQIILSINY